MFRWCVCYMPEAQQRLNVLAVVCMTARSVCCVHDKQKGTNFYLLSFWLEDAVALCLRSTYSKFD